MKIHGINMRIIPILCKSVECNIPESSAENLIINVDLSRYILSQGLCTAKSFYIILLDIILKPGLTSKQT